MNINECFLRIIKKSGLSKLTFKLKSKRHEFLKIGKEEAKRSFSTLNSISKMSGESSLRSQQAKIEDNYDVHFIIPSFNCDKFIRQCLNSIHLKKHTFFITVIDDGSTDKTREVVQNCFNSLGDNCQLILKENGGAASARNAGLENIKGKYIAFVDADDMINSDSFDNMLDIALKEDMDIVQAAYVNIRENGKRKNTSTPACGYLSPIQITGFPCIKIIKASLFKNIHFPSGFLFEDTNMCYLVYPLCKKSFGTDRVCYYYRRYSNSITLREKGKPKSLDALYVIIQLENDRDKIGLAKNKEHYEIMLRQAFWLYARINPLGKRILKDVFVVYANLVNKRYPDYSTEKENLKPIEKSIRTGDYSLFYNAIKYLNP